MPKRSVKRPKPLPGPRQKLHSTTWTAAGLKKQVADFSTMHAFAFTDCELGVSWPLLHCTAVCICEHAVLTRQAAMRRQAHMEAVAAVVVVEVVVAVSVGE